MSSPPWGKFQVCGAERVGFPGISFMVHDLGFLKGGKAVAVSTAYTVLGLRKRSPLASFRLRHGAGSTGQEVLERNSPTTLEVTDRAGYVTNHVQKKMSQ